MATSDTLPSKATLQSSPGYPLRVMYDAQSVLLPKSQIGKRLHLLNLLGPKIDTFVGLSPPTTKDESPYSIIQRGFSYHLLWQQTSLPRALFSEKPDVFLAPFNSGPLLFPKQTKLLLIVHDLIPFEKFPNVPPKHRILLAYSRYVIAASIRRASLIVTVSEYSRRQILSYFPSANVVVLENTISESWYVRDAVVPESDRGDYLMLVTSMTPQKNIDRTFQAYSEYLRGAGDRPVDLRIAGLVAVEVERLLPRINELGIQDHVSFLPYLSESDLQSLYRNAKGLLVPSLSEGFGIPVLEAMASGTPVICSSATCLPEVGGSAPEYFDPYNVSEMAGAMTKVLSDGPLRASMIERGLSRAEIYHPDVVHKQASEFWDDLPGLIA